MKKTLNIKILTIVFLSVLFVQNGFSQFPVAVEKDGMWGYQTAEGKIVIDAKYILANEFSKYGIASVIDDEGWAYINTKGEILVRPFIFDNGPDYFSEGVARYQENGKFGFFDKKGNIVIPAKYDFALPFSEGMAVVSKGCVKQADGEHFSYIGGKWGYINKQGDIAIPLKFEDATSYEDGRARVKLGKWYYIDINGKVDD